MKLPAYDQYKMGGSEWCEPIPAHWSIEPLKYNSYVKGRIGWQNLRSDEFTDEGPFLITGMHFKDGSVDWNQCYHITEERYAIAPEIQVRQDDVLITKDGSIGKLAHLRELPGKASLNSHLLVIRPLRERYIPRYLYLLLSSLAFRFHIELHQSGTTFFGITQESVVKFGVILPSIPEQRAIVAFLDREIGRVDQLVAKKRELIERLKEKRTALISRTVTRGLPPAAARVAGLPENPPLKPSALDWLGDIPAHWGIPPLYTRYSIELGKMLDEARIVGHALVPYLRNIDVQWDHINLEDLPEMDIEDTERERFTIRAGDLLVCEGGEVGRAAIFSGRNEITGYQKALHRMRPLNRHEDPRFMFYILAWASSQGVFMAQGNPNTISHLTGEKLRRYRFPQPPFLEQVAIAAYLDKQTAKLDALVAKVESAIERLQEYRTALMTAAVTGKIDVRETALDEAASKPRESATVET